MLKTEDDFKTLSSSAAHAPNGVLSDIRILVADDCEENQFLFTHLLNRKGAKVQIASNGAEALELARRENFDVILMDIQMPVMDGFTALLELQARGQQTPVIAITADSLPAQKQKILDAGFSNVVTKPIDRNFLIQAMLEALLPGRGAKTHG